MAGPLGLTARMLWAMIMIGERDYDHADASEGGETRFRFGGREAHRQQRHAGAGRHNPDGRREHQAFCRCRS